MIRISLISFLILGLSLPASAANYRNAQSLREAMLEKETQRWSGIGEGSGLVLCKRLMGNRTVTFHEAVKKDGSVYYVRHVSPFEMQQRLDEVNGIDPNQKHAFAKHYAEGLDMLYQGLASETGGTDMKTLMGMQGAGDFLTAGAPSPEELAKMEQAREADKTWQFADLDQFFKTAKLVGRETVNGRRSYHLRSGSTGFQVQQDQGYQFDPKSADVWIDEDELVLVKFKVSGRLTSDGQTRDMTIEQSNSDFRQVGPLFEPHHQISRLGGVLSAKEQKQMEQAQKELAKFKKELEAMPTSQQNMIKQMMGSKMEQFEKMASSGGIEMETIIDRSGIGTVVDYSLLMANYAAGVPLNQLPGGMNPFGQQP